MHQLVTTLSHFHVAKRDFVTHNKSVINYLPRCSYHLLYVDIKALNLFLDCRLSYHCFPNRTYPDFYNYNMPILRLLPSLWGEVEIVVVIFYELVGEPYISMNLLGTCMSRKGPIGR